MIYKVLSIDFDYFQDTTLEPVHIKFDKMKIKV